MYKSILLFIIILSLSFSLQAQNRYIKKLERKVKQRLERKADQKVDEGLDKVEESLEKKAKKSNEPEQTSDSAEASSTATEDTQIDHAPNTTEKPQTSIPNILGSKKKQKPLDRNPDFSFGEEANPALALYQKLEIGDEKPIFEKPATYPNKRRYLTKSGTVEMARVVVNPNVTIETRETLYYDEWGWKEARLIHEKQKVSMLGFNQVNESFKLTIMDGENLATVDLEDLKGGLSRNDFYEDLANMNRAQEQQFAEGVTESMDAKTVDNGTEIISGKTCKVTTTTSFMEADTMMVTRLAQWKNVTLKSDSEGMGSIIKERTFKVSEGVLPKDIFYLPVKAKLTKISLNGIPSRN